ncbi:hypothetical protein [Microcoleus sp. FACHB-68]|uniref:hypothetical protein n=1 Tax=Microcoleus sp. FACHB-68 TaxID=2692826 RepID=UPI001687A3E9|nr:hypothetical protein [Microcoleus sp. FACHB-68]MBD1938592.1 hypothetical protein [Microcoleus sp. FACHB-68]
MTHYSPAVILTWEMAAAEATIGNATHIEPAHLAMALCKLCDTGLENLLAGTLLKPQEQDEVRADVEFLKQKFQQAEFNLTRFRQRLRAQITKPAPDTPLPQQMHRSAASKQVFHQAETLAEAEGEDVRLIHLLEALLTMPAPPWTGILSDMGFDNPLGQILEIQITQVESALKIGLAASQMQQLIDEISTQDLNSPKTLGIVENNIAAHPVLKDKEAVEAVIKHNQKVKKMLKVGGIELLKAIFPPAGIAIAMVQAWMQESSIQD